MPNNLHLALTVNGEPTEVAFAPYKTLLEVLREDLNLCGTKHGCELGECGACAVLLDGQPVLSCLVLGVECDGRDVLTVEGLGDRRPPPPVAGGVRGPRRGAVRLLHAGVPGHGKALLDEHPDPTRDEIREALSGCLCRCTGYQQIFEAVEAAVERSAKASASPKHSQPDAGGTMNIIGTPRRRVDGRAKVTGQTRFADDVMLPRMVHCKLLRSTVPHARIMRIDASRALARPGVLLVLTGARLPHLVRHPARQPGRARARRRSRPLRRRSGRRRHRARRADGVRGARL